MLLYDYKYSIAFYTRGTYKKVKIKSLTDADLLSIGDIPYELVGVIFYNCRAIATFKRLYKKKSDEVVLGPHLFIRGCSLNKYHCMYGQRPCLSTIKMLLKFYNKDHQFRN